MQNGTPVTWIDGDEIPDVEQGFLVADDAERFPPQVWERVTRLLRAHPDLRLRLAAHTTRWMPSEWDADVVTDLYFSLDEIQRHLRNRGSATDARLVAMATGGHPADVDRIAEARVTQLDQMRKVLASAGRSDALAGSETGLAIPQHLSARLVEQLGGPDDFLDRAVASGLGRWSDDPIHPAFELVPSIREATRQRAAVTARTSIHVLAAETFLAEDAAFPAFSEAVAAGRLDLVNRAVKLGALPMLGSHAFSVKTHLMTLSFRQLSQYPVLALALALILNARRQHRLRAAEMLGVAIVGARLSRHAPASDKALVRLIESVGLRLTGAGDGGVAAARSAIRKVDELTPDERAELGHLEPDLRLYAAMSLMYGGHGDEAARQFELAITGASRPAVELLATGALACLNSLSGDIHQAEEWLRIGEERHWPADLIDGYAGTLFRLSQAQCALEHGDLALAEKMLDLVWHEVETIEHWPLMAHVRALVDLADGNPAEGLERFRSLRRRRTGRRGQPMKNLQHLEITESLLLLATGDGAGAARLLSDRSTTDPGHLLAAARVALVADDQPKFLRLLARVSAESPADRMTRAALLAVLLARQNRAIESAQAVDEVAALHAEYGLTSPLIFLPHGERGALEAIVPGLPEALAPLSPVPVLTKREIVVLQELTRTADPQQIADSLHVSVNTVKSQRRTLYRKLGASSRDEALAIALTYGLLDS